MKRHLVKTLFLILGVLFAVNPLAHAKYEYKFDKRLNSYGQYESETTGKLTRGATNIAYGWTEILQTPIRMSEGPRNHAITGVLLGVPYGILRFAGRTLVGAYEVVTCLVPQPPIFSPIGGDVV